MAHVELAEKMQKRYFYIKINIIYYNFLKIIFNIK